jgi:hypothetical protein
MSWEAEVANITTVMVAVAYGMDHLKGEAVVDERYLCSLLLCSGHRKSVDPWKPFAPYSTWLKTTLTPNSLRSLAYQ